MQHMYPFPDLLVLLRRGCVAAAGRDIGPLSPELEIQALGIDSVALLELVSWAEEQVGVRIPDEELARIRTIDDLCRKLSAPVPPAVVE